MDAELLWAAGWFVVAALLGAGLTALAPHRPAATRLLLGAFWLPMAATNATAALAGADYGVMADNAVIPGVESLFENVVALLTPLGFGLAAATYQVALALLILGRGNSVKLGLLGSVLYLVGVACLGVGFLPALFLTLPYLLLSRLTFDTGVVDARRFHRLRTWNAT